MRARYVLLKMILKRKHLFFVLSLFCLIHFSTLLKTRRQTSDTRGQRSVPVQRAVYVLGQPSLRSLYTNHVRPESSIIAAALMVRIYEHDKAELKVIHLDQWIMFALYSGVDHIYVYDTYQSPHERLRDHLSNLSFVTYHDWSEYGKPEFSLFGTQVPAYQHAIDHYGDRYMWHMSLDMDEYVTSEVDLEFGFLSRYLSKVTDTTVSEITLSNYLAVGGMNRDDGVWMAEKYKRLFLEPDTLCKPIYRPKNVRAGMHHTQVLTGTSIIAERNQMRMTHVHGARHDDWSANVSQHIMDVTQDDRWMPVLTDKVKQWAWNRSAELR